MKVLETKLGSYTQTDFARNNTAREEYKAIERYKRPLIGLVQSGDTEIQVWTREDYFKAVELSAHIEQDSMGNTF
ncbi:hypothetical protein ACMAZD_09860 [Vibrio sp. nBUS_14]|uniref:hypothetical protein n=1 Tax=Vibrio sp. nBUS_14 TaxID=3395321 RepID=UPI003EC1264E